MNGLDGFASGLKMSWERQGKYLRDVTNPLPNFHGFHQLLHTLL